MYYTDEAKYDGKWKNDKIEEKGMRYYNDGEKYDGERINGNFEGKGI